LAYLESRKRGLLRESVDEALEAERDAHHASVCARVQGLRPVCPRAVDGNARALALEARQLGDLAPAERNALDRPELRGPVRARRVEGDWLAASARSGASVPTRPGLSASARADGCPASLDATPVDMRPPQWARANEASDATAARGRFRRVTRAAYGRNAWGVLPMLPSGIKTVSPATERSSSPIPSGKRGARAGCHHPPDPLCRGAPPSGE
jgi:hypothetical protein